ncbi:copper chaperone PCu(A)C [Corynebacterium hindlerae]|uniref:Copper chaperone PCu(A)C n=1 Tax=Corynebacterium hindlerae TaxID=699041 RepID=A0A7G5FFP6_9CORY|nr:copper chaperone PCu(A)C [Corynebacterium hindlerae]QMV85437.1 copper chaperone PCu(A)C [Corynebacterium hindlerae]QTH58684.1 copper chaperone PCu(A)C [Corynebacterium hindlerae]
MNASIKKISTIAIAALTAASLAACGNSQKDSETKVETATGVEKPAQTSAMKSEKTTAVAAANEVTFEDTFVKAKPADKSMTGIFGTLKNGTSKDVKIESFTTNLNAGKYEIHEVVNGVMQLKSGGITIPAGGEYVLKPGGDHLMIMDINDPIEAGTTVKVTLNFSNGESVDVNSEVRTIASGQENYGANGGVEGVTGMTPAATPMHDHNHDHNHG